MGWEGAGLPKGGGMQFLFEGLGGRGELSQLASIIILLQKNLFNSTAPCYLR